MDPAWAGARVLPEGQMLVQNLSAVNQALEPSGHHL